ncbi:hypothetical protein WKH56_19860 [Priestia sp. SB1]|uniref:hypothetical protein n=1 Tax=Priestia sp. SB1 TaxID=3132359 RepID=UPI00317134D1
MKNFNYAEIIKGATLESEEVVNKTVETMLSKTTKEVIEDLAANWNSFKEETKAKLAVDIAGRYNLARTISLMNGLNAQLSN